MSKPVAPTRHALQSEAWLRFQKALGRKVYPLKGDGWVMSCVLEKGDVALGGLAKRLYVPYGPFAESEEALHDAIATLQKRAKKLGVAYARVEPTPFFAPETLQQLGLKRAPRTSQPEHTLILDLNKSEDELLADMTSANRRLWRRINEHPISFHVTQSLDELQPFLDMSTATSKRTGAVFRPDSYLKTLLKNLGPTKEAGLAYASVDNKPLSGIFYLDDIAAKTRYYLYAASFDDARKHNCNPALASFLIFDAKKAGFKHFDFFGVSPAEDKNHPWAGLSAFKRTFGGEEVTFSGTWELPVHKLSHATISFIRKAAKKRKH